MDKNTKNKKLIVRLPKILHKTLIETAEKNNISINKYCTFLLSNAIRNINIDIDSSGNLTLRIPFDLYNDIQTISIENNTSINQTFVYLLSKEIVESEHSKNSIYKKLQSIISNDNLELEIKILNNDVIKLKPQLEKEIEKIISDTSKKLEPYQAEYLEKQYPVICTSNCIYLIIPTVKLVISSPDNNHIIYNGKLKDIIGESENHIYTIGNTNEMFPHLSYEDPEDFKKAVIYFFHDNIDDTLNTSKNIIKKLQKVEESIKYNLQPTYLLQTIKTL